MGDPRALGLMQQTADGKLDWIQLLRLKRVLHIIYTRATNGERQNNSTFESSKQTLLTRTYLPHLPFGSAFRWLMQVILQNSFHHICYNHMAYCNFGIRRCSSYITSLRCHVLYSRMRISFSRSRRWGSFEDLMLCRNTTEIPFNAQISNYTVRWHFTKNYKFRKPLKF